MFCGIVTHTGKLTRIQSISQGQLVSITTPSEEDWELGESIAVDGACLTVTAIQKNTFQCMVSPETLKVTRAKHYQVGQLLNLERAAKIGDRIGGHWVTGHIDQTLRVSQIKKMSPEFTEICLSGCLEASKAYLIPKGSVTINGVSLTINHVTKNTLSVMLVPYTLNHTNLAAINPDDRVNIEWDYLAKLVQQQLVASNTASQSPLL